MADLKVFRADERKFEQVASPPGSMLACRDVTTAFSTSMGCGTAVLEKLSFPWTVNYDEYFYVIEGAMRVTVKGGSAIDLRAGDACWVPKGTTLTYEAGEKVRIVYAIYPGNASALD